MNTRLFTEEILMMLFDECGLDFEEWAEIYDYANMTDQQIYNALPSEILPFLGDIGLNASWMHQGM